MTTFTWKVANLERNVADGKVNTVHYTVTLCLKTLTVSPILILVHTVLSVLTVK
jgi:hypothetical protein